MRKIAISTAGLLRFRITLYLTYSSRKVNMRKIALFLAILPSIACAQNFPVQNWCTTGGAKVTTQGLNSATTVQQSYPKCTVTVFISGTTNLATIYSDPGGDSLSNPFTANTDGSWTFYGPIGSQYDVQMSGGTAPNIFLIPFTLHGLLAGSSSGNFPGGVTGSLIYQSNTNITTTLPPNTSTTKLFLTQTGTGSAGQAPAWGAITSGDISPLLTTIFASPPPIGNVIPNTGNFTSIAAPTGNISSLTSAILANGCSPPISGLNSISINGVFNPACFSGSDMGAQINTAYAACSSGAAGCLIKVPPGTYNISTPIQIMTKGIGAIIDCGSTNTVLNWTPTSGTMFQFATGGAGTSTWSSGIRNCTLTGPSTGTATAIVLGVPTSDSTGRTAQGTTISDSNINGFNIQLDLESQSWNNTFYHSTFNNAITYEVYYNPAAVNSGENIHFISDTFDTTSSTFLLNALNLGLLSAYTTFTGSNFDNVQLTNNGGEISFQGVYFEDPNAARGANPYINLQTGQNEGINIKMINQQTADTSPTIYNKGTLTWVGGEMASGSGTTPVAVKNDVHGHSFICGDISVPGQLVDNSTTDQKSIDCTPGFGMNLNRTPFSITDSTGGTLSFLYTNAGTLRWNHLGNGFEVDSWGPNATTAGTLTLAGLASDGSHGLSYIQCTPTGTGGTCTASGNWTIPGNLITNGTTTSNGNFFLGPSANSVTLSAGGSGALVVVPKTGASIDLAVNNAAITSNNLVVFDNGDTCISGCPATDPGTTLKVNGNSTITGNLTVNGTISGTGSTNTFPSGILLGSAPTVQLTKGTSGALVVAPATGATIDFAVNNAAQTKNTAVGFDNGDVCLGVCGATDPGYSLQVNSTSSSSITLLGLTEPSLGVGGASGVTAGLDTTNTNNSYQILFKNVGGSGSTSNQILFGLFGNTSNLTLNGNGTMALNPTNGNSFNEGLRIDTATDGYSMITLNADHTTFSGDREGQWTILNTPASSATNQYKNALLFEGSYATGISELLGGFTTVDFGSGNPPIFGVAHMSVSTSNTACWNTSAIAGFQFLVAQCTSLRRFKSHILPLEPASRFSSILDEIMHLRPVSYTSKTGEKRREIGFIAEDIQEVDSRNSTMDHGKLIGVEYDHMVALLTKAIQEQQKEIENLRSEINKIKTSMH